MQNAFFYKKEAALMVAAMLLSAVALGSLALFYPKTERQGNAFGPDQPSNTSSCSDTTFSGAYLITKYAYPPIGTAGPDPELFLNSSLYFNDSCIGLETKMICPVAYRKTKINADTFWVKDVLKYAKGHPDLKWYEVRKELGWNKPYFGEGFYVDILERGSCKSENTARDNGAFGPRETLLRAVCDIEAINADSILITTPFCLFLAVREPNGV